MHMHHSIAAAATCARPDEMVAALGCKPESLAAPLRFMVAVGIVGYQAVGQGKAKRKAYLLTALWT